MPRFVSIIVPLFVIFTFCGCGGRRAASGAKERGCCGQSHNAA